MKKDQIEVETERRFNKPKEVARPDTDPIKTIQRRIEDLELEYDRVNSVFIEVTDDNTYSRGWEQKQKDLRRIHKRIEENNFALRILINLNTKKE